MILDTEFTDNTDFPLDFSVKSVFSVTKRFFHGNSQRAKRVMNKILSPISIQCLSFGKKRANKARTGRWGFCRIFIVSAYGMGRCFSASSFILLQTVHSLQNLALCRVLREDFGLRKCKPIQPIN